MQQDESLVSSLDEAEMDVHENQLENDEQVNLANGGYNAKNLHAGSHQEHNKSPNIMTSRVMYNSDAAGK